MSTLTARSASRRKDSSSLQPSQMALLCSVVNYTRTSTTDSAEWRCPNRTVAALSLPLSSPSLRSVGGHCLQRDLQPLAISRVKTKNISSFGFLPDCSSLATTFAPLGGSSFSRKGRWTAIPERHRTVASLARMSVVPEILAIRPRWTAQMRVSVHSRRSGQSGEWCGFISRSRPNATDCSHRDRPCIPRRATDTHTDQVD